MTSVHLTNAWHAASGGVRRHYLDLLDTADQLGWRMRLIVPGDATGVERIGRHGRIYTIRAPRAFAFDRRYRLLLPQTYLALERGAIVRILRREQPDIVETAEKFCLPYLSALVRKRLLPRLPRPTLIGHSTERVDDALAAHVGRHRASAAFARWYMRAIYAPPFDYHLANSEYTAAEIRAALPAHRQHVVRVAPPGVDVELFDPGRRSLAARRRWLAQCGAPSDAVLIGYAGRLSPEKHTDVLIAMVERLVAGGRRDVWLLVAGAGPDAERLRGLADARAPGRIVFLGHLTARPLLATFLASIDVFVHPNPSEPFGIGPLEAMASGTPVVVPAFGGVLTYATTGTAWLVTPGAGGLAAGVRDVLSWRDQGRIAAARRAALGFAAGDRARHYFEVLDLLHAERRTAQASAVTPVGERRPAHTPAG